MTSPISYPSFETERLVLRELTMSDSAALFDHFSDPDVTRFMDIDVLELEAEAVNIINFHAKDSGCRWGMFDRSSGDLVGSCGFHRWRPGDFGKIEVGYDLAKKHWGIGMMREALTPLIRFAFDEMGVSLIEAEVEKENGRSAGLLKKLGFQLDLTRDEPLDWFVLFRDL